MIITGGDSTLELKLQAALLVVRFIQQQIAHLHPHSARLCSMLTIMVWATGPAVFPHKRIARWVKRLNCFNFASDLLTADNMFIRCQAPVTLRSS